MKIKSKLILYFFLFIQIIGGTSCTRQKGNNYKKTMDSLLSLTEDSMKTNPQFSRKLISKAAQLAINEDDYYTIENYLLNYFTETNQIDSIKGCLSKEKIYLDKIKNIRPDYDSLIMRYNNALGVFYSYTGLLDSATLYFKKAYSETNRDRYKIFLPDICIDLADMQVRQGNYVEGIKYYREALKVADSLKLKKGQQFSTYLGLGYSYYAGLQNYNLANEYFGKAEKIKKGRSAKEKFIFYNNWGSCYYYQPNYQKSLQCFMTAKQIAESNKEEYYANLCYANLSDVYLHLNELDSAKIYLNKSSIYFSKTNMSFFLSYLALVQAGIALKEKDIELAKKCLMSYSDTDYKDAMIINIRYQLLQDYFSTIGNYKEAYQYQSKKINLNDSLRSIAIANSIAETDIRYRQDTTIIRQESALKIKDSKIHNLSISNITWIVFFLLAVIIVVCMIISQRIKLELQSIKQHNALSKIRLQNIRNRISPHFIFNVLNREISTRLDENQQNELILLASMLKRSLELTEKIAVPLADELNFVKEYILLEKSSFKDDFSYDIAVDPSIDIERKTVLAMIIQIPVENAIKHGLRPKKGQKHLFISISSYERGTKIRIANNGVEFKPQLNSSTKGTGTGLKVIYQTIANLNVHNKEKIEFSIHNIVENEGGTEVIIKLPDNYYYEA